MLTLVLWLLAIYGAVLAAWHVVMAIWNKSQTFKTGVHVLFLVQNGEEYVEGCIDPLLRGATLLKRKLSITVVNMESTDATGGILEKLAKRHTWFRFNTVSRQEADAFLLQMLHESEDMVCVVDLRTIRNPHEIVMAISGLCGK
ncbi:hypothetical protein LSG31_04080 [Fodinisporobacter ferrooxydans]|uniref:Uncharacterized protein n=1 Tax=Fodinisporobacter ferrooxydans TaxID=2901836 RepID=A0ABY4CU77_9BACL|nr:hypothetical protein LSG31_04080 [Alicyclobacillaceae bacterium MYW30-H2]